MEDEEILTQDDDELEMEMENIEKEESKEKTKKPSVKKSAEETVTNETYEGFMQPARLGIVNTVTGDIIEGFNTEKDEGVVQLGKAILNKLDKIAIASGV